MVRMNPIRAFKKRCVARDDGVAVLNRPLITVAALEAGYTLPSPMVDDEVTKTVYPGQMTQDEFVTLCENNSETKVTAKRMAKAVLLMNPDGKPLTRASLEQVLNTCSDKQLKLSEEEIDLLFDTLDTAHTSSITSEQLMQGLYGADGLSALEDERFFLIQEGHEHLERERQKEKERRRLEEERLEAERLERERLERERLERERLEAERLEAERLERERLERERQAKLEEEERARLERERLAKEKAAKEKADAEAKERERQRAAADAQAKEKAKGCC